MKEPTRLCDSDDLPAALRGAFRALERDAPDAETVLRVQRALQALPAAGASAGVATTLGTSKLWLVTTLIAGAAAFSVGVSLPRGPARFDTHPRVATLARARTSERVTIQDAVPAVHDEPLDGEQGPSQVSTPVTAKGRDLAASPRARSQLLSSAKQARFKVSGQRTTRGSESLSIAAETKPSEATPADPAHEPEPSANVSAPSAAPEAQSDEAALLAQAKRLAASDPAAALAQVEALAQRYPAGTFVQERELLAIQLHQRLGHAPAAEQLIRRFHERFPNSVYRRALPP
jgi:hypothetical protein